jgi:carboxymethylenebutenolidase
LIKKQNDMTDVTITTPAHQIRSYLARPAGVGPWPGVIVLHDATGMSKGLRHQADWLAGAGYLTVAPDLYSWGRKIACIWATMRELTAGRGKVFADIDGISVTSNYDGRGGAHVRFRYQMERE